jgi:hypothetical protein
MAESHFIGTKRNVSNVEYGPCKFFAAGHCRFGAACVYTHSNPVASDHCSMPCAYFLKGNCADGDKCRFMHISRQTVPAYEEPISSRPFDIVCKFHLTFRGCKSGDSCPFQHPPKDDFDVSSVAATSNGTGVKILEKYSMTKTAEQKGAEAVPRNNFQP